MEPQLLFVYGTLKEGFRLNYALEGMVKRGTAFTLGTLYDLGPFPALKLGGDRAVIGELYEITPEVLRRTDSIEGYVPKHTEESLYIRVECRVGMLDGRHSYDAWTYEFNQDLGDAPVVESGTWVKDYGEGYRND